MNFFQENIVNGHSAEFPGFVNFDMNSFFANTLSQKVLISINRCLYNYDFVQPCHVWDWHRDNILSQQLREKTRRRLQHFLCSTRC